MLANVTLTPDACRAEFAALVRSGVTRLAAWAQVQAQLDEIQAELIDAGLDTDDTAALLEWWSCDVDHRQLEAA